MRASFRVLARLAWRESRSTRRHLLLYMSSIALGVAALVAIDSFAGNLTRSVHEQSRALLGGDVAWRSNRVFPPPMDSLIDSLARTGTPVARVTSFVSMGVVPRTTSTRLVQVRAVTERYPFYGAVTTLPAGAWPRLQAGRHALVDPALLVSLDARIGDTLTLGYAAFEIIGTLINVPGDVGVTAAIGPRVLFPARYLDETGLLAFGSRAQYEALFRLPDDRPTWRFLNPHMARLDSNRVRYSTAGQQEREMTRAIDQLSRFLAVVGLVALLLGGVGVASGVHAFVTRKIDVVAVLRCVGATTRQVLTIYVLQAAVMGLAGAAIGALLGVAVQFALPVVLADFLPVDVNVTLEPLALGLGLLVGGWVALVFALRPLVTLRNVSPLQALRRDADAAALHLRWNDWARLTMSAVIALTVVGIAVSRARSLLEGVVASLAIAGAVAVLWGAAALLSWLARRTLRAGWPFVIRQGIANLYRPANQTRAVVLALGFGVFLIGTLYQVQAGLLRQLHITTTATQANLLFFDVQEDQAEAVLGLIRAGGYRVMQQAPIVVMRISAINGRSVTDLLADTTQGSRSTWPLRREYRSTYRDSIVGSERVVTGRWFRAAASDAADTLPEVSLETEVAREMRVKAGDVITWDVQGVKVPTRLTSTRTVEWQRFEPNFFAVLERTAIETAPKQFVILAEVPGETAVARLQGAVVARYPNVSSLDVSLIQRTIGDILAKVTAAVRFMALVSVLLGVPVLFSAVAATRRDRIREGVLLKTLGATRAQIRSILVAEYAALGVLGSLTGMLLSIASAWLLMRFTFESPFALAPVAAIAIVSGMVALSVTIGVATGRDVFRETPMAALRDV